MMTLRVFASTSLHSSIHSQRVHVVCITLPTLQDIDARYLT